VARDYGLRALAVRTAFEFFMAARAFVVASASACAISRNLGHRGRALPRRPTKLDAGWLVDVATTVTFLRSRNGCGGTPIAGLNNGTSAWLPLGPSM